MKTVPIMALGMASILALAGLLLAQQGATPQTSKPSSARKSRMDQIMGYKAAFKRLRAKYTLDRVAAEKIEVQYDDLVGMATLLSADVPVQAGLYYEPIFVQPDLSIALGKQEKSLELGFAIGEPARLADFYYTTRKLHKGYQPIVTSKWEKSPFTVTQTAFGFLPEDDEVKTGKEKHDVMIRMTFKNTSRTLRKTTFYTMMGRPGGIIRIGRLGTGGRKNGVSHWPFNAWPGRWLIKGLNAKLEDNSLRVGDRILLTFSTDDATSAKFHEELTFPPGGDKLHPATLRNVLAFQLSLAPQQTRTIDFVVAGSTAMYPESERKRMKLVTFDVALARAEKHWDRQLQGSMKLKVPEDRINKMYKGLILSCFGLTGRNPKHDIWLEAYQSSHGWESLPWEQAFMLIPMMKLGYTDYARRCLHFYIDRQIGVGLFAVTAADGYGPAACTSVKGTYPGHHSMDWLNFTGSTLWMMAEYYNYTGDAKWLKERVPSIVAACEWIQNERTRSRITDKKGNRVKHYGLISPGRAGDIPEGTYIYTFNDNYTWLGMHKISRALRKAGLKEGDVLAEQADEYRKCILDVLKREEFVDPGTGLHFIPSMTNWTKDTHDIYWHAHGPMQLFATGLLQPEDKRFAPMIKYLDKRWGILLGFAEPMGGGVWYLGQVERTYYQCYLARGEYEKALLTFYSCLAYGMSSDCFQTAERFHVFDSNIRPYMTNGSGIGRLLDMIRRCVIDEQDADDGVLWLLRGCPRKWFAKGEEIVVEDALTLFGKMSIHTKSEGDKITVTINGPDKKAPKEMNLVIRHPERKQLREVKINGRAAKFNSERIVVPAVPNGMVKVECAYR